MTIGTVHLWRDHQNTFGKVVWIRFFLKQISLFKNSELDECTCGLMFIGRLSSWIVYSWRQYFLTQMIICNHFPNICPDFFSFGHYLAVVNWDTFFDCCIGMVVQINFFQIQIILLKNCELDKCPAWQMSNGWLSAWTIVRMDDCPLIHQTTHKMEENYFIGPFFNYQPMDPPSKIMMQPWCV